MVTEPRAAVIETNDEDIVLFKALQDGLRVFDLQQRIADGRIHLLKQGGMGQETLPRRRLPAQDLFAQVFKDVAMRAAEVGDKTIDLIG